MLNFTELIKRYGFKKILLIFILIFVVVSFIIYWLWFPKENSIEENPEEVLKELLEDLTPQPEKVRPLTEQEKKEKEDLLKRLTPQI